MLKIVPAWVGPLIAGVCFLFFRLLVPALTSGLAEPIRDTLSQLSKVFAPWIAAAVFVIWILAEIKKLGDRKLLDSRPDIASLRDLTWQEFERLVGEAFRRQGYTVAETPVGADGGVDLVLAREGERTLVQCKQWKSSNVGVKTIRELFGVVAAEHANHGIVVCCGHYTRDAISFAENKPLELIDGKKLWSMIEDARPDAPGSDARSENPDEDITAQKSQPLCPKCGSTMVLRTASKGAYAGSQFYGCSRFPACRGTRQS